MLEYQVLPRETIDMKLNNYINSVVKYLLDTRLKRSWLPWVKTVESNRLYQDLSDIVDKYFDEDIDYYSSNFPNSALGKSFENAKAVAENYSPKFIEAKEQNEEEMSHRFVKHWKTYLLGLATGSAIGSYFVTETPVLDMATLVLWFGFVGLYLADVYSQKMCRNHLHEIKEPVKTDLKKAFGYGRS